jgi:hypothetical protein
MDEPTHVIRSKRCGCKHSAHWRRDAFMYINTVYMWRSRERTHVAVYTAARTSSREFGDECVLCLLSCSGDGRPRHRNSILLHQRHADVLVHVQMTTRRPGRGGHLGQENASSPSQHCKPRGALGLVRGRHEHNQARERTPYKGAIRQDAENAEAERCKQSARKTSGSTGTHW